MTFDDATGRVRVQGGFDTATSNISVADVQGWINERYKRAVAAARYRMVELDVGLTVADQFLYALDASVVEVEGLQIDGTRYEQAGTKELWDLRVGDLQLPIPRFGGVFAQEYDAGGTVSLTIYPTPDEDGQQITALCAVEPVELASGDTPIIPADLHEPILVFGAIATGLAVIDERLDSATYFEQQFQAAVDELGKRRKGRVTTGPTQIGIYGYHWR